MPCPLYLSLLRKAKPLQCSHVCHHCIHRCIEDSTKWAQFWVDCPFWYWTVEDNDPQCVSVVGAEGERLKETVAAASRHCEVTDCGCARVWTCRLLCQFVRCAFEQCGVGGYSCECRLCQCAVSQNECLLEIKLSLFILVIPAGGRRGWAWPWALRPLF